MTQLDNYEEELKIFRKVVAEYPKRFKVNKELLHELHQEELDLLHVVELVNLNASDGYKLYKELQTNRQERRKIKDENKLLEPIVSYIKQQKVSTTALNGLIGEIRNRKSTMSARGYRMNVRHDLQHTIDTKRIKGLRLLWRTKIVCRTKFLS